MFLHKILLQKPFEKCFHCISLWPVFFSPCNSDVFVFTTPTLFIPLRMFFYFCFPVLVFQYLLNNQLHTFCLFKRMIVSNILYTVYKNNEVFPRRIVVINSAYITVECVIPKQNINLHCAWRQFLFASVKSIVYGDKFLNRSLRNILLL